MASVCPPVSLHVSGSASDAGKADSRSRRNLTQPELAKSLVLGTTE